MAHSKKILVVDDSPLVRSVAREIFEDLGCAVVAAHNAAEAISLAGKYRNVLSLALIDVHMPGGMDGVALAKTLHDTYPTLNIVLTSGAVSNLPGGVGFRFLPKPWKPNQFADLVRLVENAARAEEKH